MICTFFAMISSAATVFLQKSQHSQKIHLDLKKITRLKISALKLRVSLEIICSRLSSPEDLHTICKFVKIDHAEEWKILCRKVSGCFQELKGATLRKYFTVG